MSASAGTGADYGATGGAASAAPGAASGGAAGGALTTLIPEDKKHPLYRPWTYWELRSKDKSQGIYSWQDQPTDLFTFETVEDFWSFWKRAPKISEVFDGSGHEPARIEREEVAAGGRSRTVTTKAEAYMLFRKGVAPMTEAERSPGVRWTVNRRRAELSVRPKDFDSWWGAWETTVQAIIGEIIDPDEYIVGAYLTDKHKKGSVALRLELWFSTVDDAICDAIAGELAAILKAKLPDLPFRFAKTQREKKQAAAAAAAASTDGGAAAVAAPAAGSTDGGAAAAAPAPRYGGGGGGWSAPAGGDRGDRGDRYGDRDRGGGGGGGYSSARYGGGGGGGGGGGRGGGGGGGGGRGGGGGWSRA